MKNRITLITTIISILLGLLVITYLIGITDQGHTFIHGLFFGNDQVYFHKNVYYQPAGMSAEEITSELLQKSPTGDRNLLPTGESVIGMPVYETASSISQFKGGNKQYEMLLLKRPDGSFVVYKLRLKRN